MRTTVYTSAADSDETCDEWPGCFGTVDEDGTLTIVGFPDPIVEDHYPAGEWSSYETTVDTGGAG